MAGILDNKSRVMDFIITPEGRRQLHDGFMRVDYVSYTDKETFYEASLEKGVSDASERIFLEATSTAIDQIALETDDTGQLLTYKGSTFDRFIELRSDGTIYQGDTKVRLDAVTGSSTFASLAPKMIDNVTQNFKNQKILATTGFKTGSFVLNSERADFSITDQNPLHNGFAKEFLIPTIEPLFCQSRLAQVYNFKFLKPRWYSPGTAPSLGLVGRYEKIQNNDFQDPEDPLQVLLRFNTTEYDQDHRLAMWEDLMDGNYDDDYVVEYDYYDSSTGETYRAQAEAYWPGDWGEIPTKPNKKITFEQTSDDNNILCQFFEVDADNKKVQKLDVVDGGFVVSPNIGEGAYQIFYVGKVYTDNLGYPSFVNLFTLVFT